MAAGIRLPGVPGSSSFPYLPSLSLGLAHPGPLPGAAVSAHAQPLPEGTHHPTSLLPPVSAHTFLHIVPFSFSCGPRGHPRETSFCSPTQCHPFAYFHIVPFQRSSASILERGVRVLPHTLCPVQCCSFRPCPASCYHRSCPTLEPRRSISSIWALVWLFCVSFFSFAYVGVFFHCPFKNAVIPFFFPEILCSIILAFPSWSLYYALSGMLNFILKEQMSCVVVSKSF